VPEPPQTVGGAAADATKPTDATRATSELPPTPPATPTPARTGAAGRARQRAARRKRRTAPVAAVPPPPPASQPVAYPPPVAPVRRTRRRATPPSESGLYLPWWSLVVMVGVVGALAFGILFAAMALVQPAALGDQTPQVLVVTAPPTLSQDFGAPGGPAAAPPGAAAWPTPIPQLQPTATLPLPTPVPSPTLPPGNFAVGVTVRVVGVETSGLNVRAAPGLEAQVRFQALEGETFAVTEGPQQVDGFEWWRLEAPDDPNRFGWAVRNYLMATQ